MQSLSLGGLIPCPVITTLLTPVVLSYFYQTIRGLNACEVDPLPKGSVILGELAGFYHPRGLYGHTPGLRGVVTQVIVRHGCPVYQVWEDIRILEIQICRLYWLSDTCRYGSLLCCPSFLIQVLNVPRQFLL